MLRFTRPTVLRALATVLLPCASACLARAPRHPAVDVARELRPERFFAGPTSGEGELVVRGRALQRFRVDGHGRTEPDGTFRLEQTIAMGDAAATTRTWRLRRLDARTYAATLSDARGPVSADVDGNRFHLRYEIRRPDVVMEQWLYLQPDGRTVRNIATITVLGVPWARMSESITRGAAVP
ncbi:MAG TPA: DUF3833 family protein [Gemmatirosa sp.]